MAIDKEDLVAAFREFAQHVISELREQQTVQKATLDIKEAAIYLGVHPDTVKKLIREKELPHVRIAGRLFLRPATLDEYMAQQERDSIITD